MKCSSCGDEIEYTYTEIDGDPYCDICGYWENKHREEEEDGNE